MIFFFKKKKRKRHRTLKEVPYTGSQVSSTIGRTGEKDEETGNKVDDQGDEENEPELVKPRHERP
jgi:hypothetical protein